MSYPLQSIVIADECRINVNCSSLLTYCELHNYDYDLISMLDKITNNRKVSKNAHLHDFILFLLKLKKVVLKRGMVVNYNSYYNDINNYSEIYDGKKLITLFDKNTTDFCIPQQFLAISEFPITFWEGCKTKDPIMVYIDMSLYTFVSEVSYKTIDEYKKALLPLSFNKLNRVVTFMDGSNGRLYKLQITFSSATQMKQCDTKRAFFSGIGKFLPIGKSYIAFRFAAERKKKVNK